VQPAARVDRALKRIMLIPPLTLILLYGWIFHLSEGSEPPIVGDELCGLSCYWIDTQIFIAYSLPVVITLK